MNRSHVLFCIASGLLVWTLAGSAAAEKKHRPVASPSTDEPREDLDALTAEMTQPTAGSAVPTTGFATTPPAGSGAQPEHAAAVGNAGKNPHLSDHPDLPASASHHGWKGKLLHVAKSKVVRQVATGVLLGVPAVAQIGRSPQGAPQYFGQSPWQGPLAQAAAYPAASQPYSNGVAQEGYANLFGQLIGYSAPGPFRRIQSPDGIVSFQIPSDWRVRPPLGQNYGAVSPRGESFSCGKVDVFMDAASMRAAAQALQMKGVPAQQLAFLPRLVSTPLSPDQIVVRLLPQLSGGAMQNVQILGARRMPDGSADIAYRYVLLPRIDRLTASQLPPALLRETQVSMQAEMHIQTTGGVPFGAVRTWSFLYSSVYAPQAIYSRNAAIYAAMFQSISVNGRAVENSLAQDRRLTQSMISGMNEQQQVIDAFTSHYRQNSEQQLNQFQDFNTKTGNLWVDMAGQETRVTEVGNPDHTGFVPWAQPDNSRAVHCWMVSPYPVFVDDTKTTPEGCHDLQPVH